MDAGDFGILLDLKRAGSFSGAAKRAGVAVSTVARRLDAVEARLKLRLVDRRMNGAVLTPDGERIAALVEPLVDGIARLERAAAALRTGAGRDSVTLSATEFIVSDVLAPALPRLAAAHPRVALTLRSEAQVVSLAGREADLALRMTRPEGNSLFARKLPEQRIGLFASSAYLAGRAPAAIDLSAERLLVYDDSYGRLPELDWIGTLGLEHAVALRTGSTRALLSATLAGAGLGLVSWTAARAAGLIEIPLPAPLPVRAPWLVVHRDLRRVPAIRAVHGWVVETFNRFAKSAG